MSNSKNPKTGTLAFFSCQFSCHYWDVLLLGSHSAVGRGTDGLLRKYSVTKKHWPEGSEGEGSLHIAAHCLLTQMDSSVQPS